MVPGEEGGWVMDAEKSQSVHRLAEALDACESVVVGAGAGMSTAAGFAYGGDRFQEYFGDFAERYGIQDIYSGGFYPFESPEEHWAFWSRQIWINRYGLMPKDTYGKLRRLLDGKQHFVLTTNVDHCFQRAGFSKGRLFYTQGDYGLFQCSGPCSQSTWDNHDAVRAMVESQGFDVGADGALDIPAGVRPVMAVPSKLAPTCPRCGRPATMNLRVDSTFVEDGGWHEASARYDAFLASHAQDGQRVVFLELGVGGNTPVIVKYPFWKMTARNPQAIYACVNKGDAWVPPQIQEQSICIDGDIDAVLDELAGAKADVCMTGCGSEVA